MIKKDAFGTEYDDSCAHITLHNGRVIQVLMVLTFDAPDGSQYLDRDGNLIALQVMDDSGFKAVDVDATFSAQTAWLAAHPEEWYPFPGQLDRDGVPIILDWVRDDGGNWVVDPTPYVPHVEPASTE